MIPRRLSIAGLMGLVVAVSLGLASLRSASVLWTSIATTVALALLLSALLGVCFLRGPDRAYCAGFALFGGVYLVLVNWSWIGAQFGHDLTGGLGDLAERVHAFDEAQAFSSREQRTESRLQNRIKIGNFVQIGRVILTLVFALLGGYVARSFAVRSVAPDRGEPRQDDPPA